MPIDSETRKVIGTFLDETREAIAEIEPTLVELESLLGTDEVLPVINRIFGVYHSVKGGAGLLEFGEIERVTHAAEAVLQRVRDAEIDLDGALVDLLCQGLDFVGDRLDAIEETLSDEGRAAVADDLVARLRLFAPDLDDAAEAGILLFVDDDVVRIEDDGSGELIDDPPDAWTPDPEDDGSARLRAFAGDVLVQLDESAEALSRVAHGQHDVEIVNRAWQALHVLKGASGERGLDDLELLAQATETVLDQLRELVRSNPADEEPVVAICRRVRRGLAALREALLGLLSGGNGRIAALEEIASAVLGARQTMDSTRLGDLLLQAAYVTPSMLERAIERQHQRPRLGEVLVEMEALEPEELDAVLEVQQRVRSGDDPPPTLPPRTKRHETLRVDVDKVDRLMDLVGELIIGVTSVVHHPDVQALGSGQFDKAAAQLSRITRDMQDVAMSLRMVPVRGTFRKMRRLVRDLAKKLGKQVNLEITGAETEVDKSVAEVIADPIVHLVRNALDHGLETGPEREAAGKSAEGTIHLTARHQGGEVWIEIIDDGRGSDRERVYARAERRGITTRPIGELSDREIDEFIFEPGFSTAAQVSEVSGRGMGMDVVKRNVESVSGRIEIESEPGQGTRIALRIPLTLAIIEGMLVRVGESCFTIPLLQIRESMVVSGSDLTLLSNGQEIVRIRDQLLPLVRMHDFYGIRSDCTELSRGIVMVVEDAGAPLCIFVDELIGQRQTVIKGLSGYLRAIRGLSGCTVLGDGRISFILDVASLRSHAVAQGVA